MIGEPTLSTVAGLGLEPIDEVDHVVEAAATARANAASTDRNGQMGLAGTGTADQHDIALRGEEAAAGEISHQRLIDWCAVKYKAVEILGQGKLGDGELVFDRAGLLLADLSPEQVADDVLRLVLTLNGGGHDLVEGGLHAVEAELTHEIEDLGSFHQQVLLRLS